MPEGDSIFRAARALDNALRGKIVTVFEATLAKLASVDDNTPIAGRIVERVEARAKYCLMFFSGDLILLTHMRMSGSWHLYRAGERWQLPRSTMRIAITCGNVQAVGFNIPFAEFHTSRSLERSTQLSQLGLDVLGGEYSVTKGTRALLDDRRQHPDAEVGNVLLNQRVIAGLGNVYKSEVAFAAGVNPFRQMRSVTARELEKMAEAAERFLQANVAEGASARMTTYTGPWLAHDVDRNSRLWVYRRAGQECRRCGTTIEMRRQGTGARSTYWCPACQPSIGADK